MASNFNNLKYFIYHVGKEVAKSPCKTLRYSSAGIYCSASGGCNHKLCLSAVSGFFKCNSPKGATKRQSSVRR